MATGASSPTHTGTSGFPNAVAIYYDKVLLDRLELDLFFDQFGQKKTLPKNSGNEIKFTRYSNFAANTSALSETADPAGLALQSTQISAIPAQYGDYVMLTEALEMEKIDSGLEEVYGVLGYRAALSLDTIIRNTLHNGLTNQFAAGAANEGATSAVVLASEVRKAVKALRTLGVDKLEGGNYQSIIHPATSFDLQSDTAAGGWLDVNKYTSRELMLKGEVGKLYGTRFVESANVQTGTGASAAVTYRNFVFGKGAYGLVDLAGKGKPETVAHQRGSSGIGDPLNRFSTVGYKFWHITKVLDATRGIEIYGTSAS